MTDGIAMKVKRKVIPFQLQKQIPQQLHSNQMGIRKMRLLVCESVHWVNMNIDIKNTVGQCAIHLDYQQTKPHEDNTIWYTM